MPPGSGSAAKQKHRLRAVSFPWRRTTLGLFVIGALVVPWMLPSVEPSARQNSAGKDQRFLERNHIRSASAEERLALLPSRPRPPQHTRRDLHFGSFRYELPEWWDTVELEVEVPEDFENSKEVSAFVKKLFGKDVGGDSWQQAIKIYAIAFQEMGEDFPVYLAHCHDAGGEHHRAAEIYGQLFDLAHQARPAKKDWYEAYLAYSAGSALEELNKPDLATEWFTRSAALRGHDDSAIRYYAGQSAKHLERLQGE